MKNPLIGALLATVLLLFNQPTTAEDIDLFVGVQAPPGDLPNVLIVLDNTGNWSTPFTSEIYALASTLSSLPVESDGTAKFNVGFMLFTETSSGDKGNDGGYVRAAVRPLTTDYKNKLTALVNSFDAISDRSNSGKAGKTMAEAYNYFAGLAPQTGGGASNYKVKTDYTGNTSGTAASKAIYALSGNALNSLKGTPYNSPVSPGSCAKNFIIYISNGAAQDSASDNQDAKNWLTAAAAAAGVTGATTTIPISPSGSQGNFADEWARFMHNSNLGVVTYTVDVNKVTTGQGPGWTALLKSMASVSIGKYFDVSSGADGSEISGALGDIFSEIQAVNSVFASVSLPVSVSTQGTYLNQIYVGMFRPDEDAFPRWAGNLKQYKLGLNANNKLETEDANGNNAINSSTGFITECARSYWTPSAVDTYWTFKPQGGCLTVANSNASNYPDGAIVEKGGQGYKLRSTTTRTVKTCSATFAACQNLSAPLPDFSSTYATQALLGAANTTERDTLINWEKGLDVPTDAYAVGDENNNGVTLTEMRPSVHGDVVHSRPVAINFGTDISPQVVVFYGDNGGVLHAINGNRSANIGGVTAGSELWAFVPPEFYPKIKYLRDDTTQISFYGNLTCATSPCIKKPYGIDGPITTFQGTVGGTAKTFIYTPMRRGGRALYAFDVSNPASPSLKWKIGCPDQSDDTDCTTGLDGVGQTWSSAKSLKASGYATGGPGTEKPMIIMGGGYDTCEDADPNTCSSGTKGNHIYVFDADTGTLLATLNTDRAVAGDVFVISDTGTGLAKWAYAADLGGNLYRISGVNANTPFNSTPPGSWTITKVASLGCATTASCSANRKFMFSPDITLNIDGTYSLIIGSGDREKPIMGFSSAYNVTNHFFMVKDKPTEPTWLSSESTNCEGNNVICLNSLGHITASSGVISGGTPTMKGWYLDLNPHEQVVTSAITVFGVTTFSTHTPWVPVDGVCSSNLGTAHVYNIDYSTAASANGTSSGYQVVSGGGLPPSPVAGKVTLDNGMTVPFLIGGSAESPLGGGSPTPVTSAARPKGRVYWYIQQ